MEDKKGWGEMFKMMAHTHSFKHDLKAIKNMKKAYKDIFVRAIVTEYGEILDDTFIVAPIKNPKIMTSFRKEILLHRDVRYCIYKDGQDLPDDIKNKAHDFQPTPMELPSIPAYRVYRCADCGEQKNVEI